MRFSIITAVYNNEKKIAFAIRSVLSQTYPDIEHIVIDGGSTDATLMVIRSESDGSIRLISEPDRGIYDALNKGIQRATGEVVGVLHSDDTFDGPHVIAAVADVFQRTGCDAVYGDLVFTSKPDPKKVVRVWKSRAFDMGTIRRGWMPPHPTLFLKSKVYLDYGLYDTRYTIAADYDLILRTLGSGELRCEYLPMVITRMRVGGVSTGGIRSVLRKSREDLHVLRRNRVGGFPVLLMKNLTKVGQLLAPVRRHS